MLFETIHVGAVRANVRDVSNAAIEDKVKSWLRQTQYNWIGTAIKHLSVAMKLLKLVNVSDCLKMTTSRRLTMKTRRSSIAIVERLYIVMKYTIGQSIRVSECCLSYLLL